jgi:hypothetical protein
MLVGQLLITGSEEVPTWVVQPPSLTKIRQYLQRQYLTFKQENDGQTRAFFDKIPKEEPSFTDSLRLHVAYIHKQIVLLTLMFVCHCIFK